MRWKGTGEEGEEGTGGREEDEEESTFLKPFFFSAVTCHTNPLTGLGRSMALGLVRMMDLGFEANVLLCFHRI